MKTGLFHTCKNYKVQYLPKDILSGIIMAESVHTDCDGIRGSGRTSGSLRTLRFGISDFVICDFFYVATVYHGVDAAPA